MPNVSTRPAAQQLALFGHGKLPAREHPRPTNPWRARLTPGAPLPEPPRGKPLPLDKLFQEGPRWRRGTVNPHGWCAAGPP
jgi:hypothetical protein